MDGQKKLNIRPQKCSNRQVPHISQSSLHQPQHVQYLCPWKDDPHSHVLWFVHCLGHAFEKIDRNISRVEACGRIFGSTTGWKNFTHKQKLTISNKQTIGLLYDDTNGWTPISKQNLPQLDILQIGMMLVTLLLKSKQKHSYIGTIFPNRIFQSPSKSYHLIGGQFMTPQCSPYQFMMKNVDVKDQIFGKFKYQPPELYADEDGNTQIKGREKGRVLNYLSDLFVVACVLCQMVIGEYPYRSLEELLAGRVSHKIHKNQITDQLYKLVLSRDQQSRITPNQLLKLLSTKLHHKKYLFSTSKLPSPSFTPSSTASSSASFTASSTSTSSPTLPSFLDNLHQFIMKRTTQTQGWFLYYCDNNENAPDGKYLELILRKIVRKNEKVVKIVALMEKILGKGVIKDGGEEEEDYTFSMIKMGILMINMLRKIPYAVEEYLPIFSKICSKIVTEQPANKYLTILFKIIGFKISLGNKFPILQGNFLIPIQSYQKTTPQSLQYLIQYILKILSYFPAAAPWSTPAPLTPCQTCLIVTICDQLYNGISTFLYVLMSMKKDKKLGLLGPEEQGEGVEDAVIGKLDQLGRRGIRELVGACGRDLVFGNHNLYSICDYFQYQQDVCLIYEPIITSYQYFYLDNNHYKGLQLPRNQLQFYRHSDQHHMDEFGDEDGDGEREGDKEDQRFRNRKLVRGRLSGRAEMEDQPKCNTNQFKLDSQEVEKPKCMKSQGSKLKTPELVRQTSKTEKNITQIQVQQFQQFLTKIQSKPAPLPQSPSLQKESSSSSSSTPTMQSRATTPSINTTTSTPTPISKNSSMTTTISPINKNMTTSASTTSTTNTKQVIQNLQQSWLQGDQHDIFSYQWLKRTEKIVNRNFQKPQLDSVIYAIYEQLCQGLKLSELLAVLQKNIKAIVDPALITFDRIIGSGSAGDVYIGTYQPHPQQIAIKKQKSPQTPTSLKQFQRELLTYLKIKPHPNLGSLFQLLHRRLHDVQLGWRQRVGIGVGIAKGMRGLHGDGRDLPILHRDLKSLNVFVVSRDGDWVPKVADFGLSRTPDTGMMMTSALGTLHWMAPELLCNKQYSLKVDVYSFGILLWQICSRRTPYHNIPNQMGIVKHVVLEKGRPLLELINQGCPKQLVQLMQRCWAEDPEERPYFGEIVKELEKIKV